MLLRSHPVEALELLHQLYNKSLFRIAYRLTRDQDEARDIVQETFQLVWQNRKQLSRHHEKSIEHYIVRVVRNKAVSYFNRRRHLNIDNLQFLKVAGSDHHINESDSLEQELILEIRNQIKSFPMREQQCLLMKIDREMSLDEIAAELKVSRKMVEKSQTNALKRLRKWAKTRKIKP